MQFQINKPPRASEPDSADKKPKRHPHGYRSPREMLAAMTGPNGQAKFDIELVGSQPNPASLFQQALPSLKLSLDATDPDNLSSEQKSALERKKAELLENLRVE